MNYYFGWSAAILGAGFALVQGQAVQAISKAEISKTAQSITVMIQDVQNPKLAGSGVIIKRDGQTYTVLTAQHVLNSPNNFKVMVADKKQYPVIQGSIQKFPGVDLALIQFTSTESYSVAKMGDSDKSLFGTAIFVAGFPETTEFISEPGFYFMSSEIAANTPRPSKDGYAIAYNNPTLPGMSGGPVLNEKGELIAIHGRIESAVRAVVPQNAKSREDIYVLKAQFNYAVPINVFLKMVPQVNSTLTFQTPNTSVASQSPPATTATKPQPTTTAAIDPPQLAVAPSPPNVYKIAKATTLLIEGQGSGSGVIISKVGNTYFVLTAKHVVQSQDEYTVTTPSGKKYPLDYKQIKKLADIDLAVAQFTSNENLSVVQLGNSEPIDQGDIIYVSGWPAEDQAITKRSQFASKGEIAGVQPGNADGYELMYGNSTGPRMSGGPIFNSNGQLVGIHGRAAGNEGIGKVGINLGIPVHLFLRQAPQAGLNLNQLGLRAGK
jgi:serine protease Do